MKITYILLLAIALAVNVNAQDDKEQAVPLTTPEESKSFRGSKSF